MMQTSNGILGNKWATLVAGSALLLNVASAQPQYNAVDIGNLGGLSAAWIAIDGEGAWFSGQASYTTANGINNSGQVVGGSVTTMLDVNYNPVYHAFLYSGATMTDLGTLSDPTNNSTAYAINDNGQVVGTADAYYTESDGSVVIVSHPFLYSGGTMADLFPTSNPCCDFTQGPGIGFTPQGINTSTQIVGSVQGCGVTYPFLYSGGTFGYFGSAIPPWPSSANAINNRGQVVGMTVFADPPYGDQRAFLFSPNSGMLDLGSLTGANGFSCADAINDNGQIVGVSWTSAGDLDAFIYTNGTMTDLGTLGGDTSCANGINTNGQIVGASYLSDDSAVHAFLYSIDSGTMVDLNNLVCTNSIGTYLTEAFGINESGQIIANGANGHAYLLTPASQAPPPAPPAFLSITQTNGTFSFTWSTVSCYTYQVQYNPDLTSTNWSNLGSASTATNGTMSASDSIGINLQRFYRVLVQ